MKNAKENDDNAFVNLKLGTVKPLQLRHKIATCTKFFYKGVRNGCGEFGAISNRR